MVCSSTGQDTRCVVLGVLDNGIEGLTTAARTLLRQADVVIGGSRVLELFAGALRTGVQTRDLTGHLNDAPDWVMEGLNQQKCVVVLATGDPLCHGLAGYLVAKLGAGRMRILPNASTLQLAFARAGIAWHDAHICSIHGKDAGEWVSGGDAGHGLYPLLRACLEHDKLAVFTSPKNTPDRIARMLVAEGLDTGFDMIVAERLLQEGERIVQGIAIPELSQQKFAGPNVVILLRRQPRQAPVLFGLSDGEYRQRKPDRGLITKCEVRAVSLAHMQLRSGSTVWDIGAGSGSVGLEAARLCPGGWVYAIEKNEADCAIVRDNRRTMDIHNYSLSHARAPDGLDGWPDPDAVFIGGSGGELAGLIRLCMQRLSPGGRLVMNFATIENLAAAVAALKLLDVEWDVAQLQVSRSKPVLEMQRMAAENPVWVVTAKKDNHQATESKRT